MLWQIERPSQQQQRRRNLVIEVKIKPLTKLVLEPLLGHAKCSHSTGTTSILELPYGQRVNTFLLYQLLNTHLIDSGLNA